METVIDEIRTNAPSIYQLFRELGDTRRNAIDETISAEQRKIIMSLCTIMNARSQRVNGLQLLLSFMLIARATSKQVSTIHSEPLNVVYLEVFIMVILCTLYLIGYDSAEQGRGMHVIPNVMGVPTKAHNRG